jgi:hypothetical protein
LGSGKGDKSKFDNDSDHIDTGDNITSNYDSNNTDLERNSNNMKKSSKKTSHFTHSNQNTVNTISSINNNLKNTNVSDSVNTIKNVNVNMNMNAKKESGRDHRSKSYSGEESSGHDSIIYTRDIQNARESGDKNNYDTMIKSYIINQEQAANTKNLHMQQQLAQQVVNTMESCTSSEFRHGLGVYNESSFISQGNEDIGNLNIDIKSSNI